MDIDKKNPLEERIQTETESALKNHEEVKLSTLRLLISAIANKRIEKRGKGEGDTFTEKEIEDVVRKEIKKRKESAELFEKGGRPELAEKERAEIQVLSAYVPAEMNEDDLKKIVEAVIADVKPTGPKDFGKVMSEVMKQTGGKAEGSTISAMIKKCLG
jgi:uncharacterized protein YqeY